MKPMSHLPSLAAQLDIRQSDSQHTANFPDPHHDRPGAFRAWLSAGGGLVISVDGPREARLVLKTVMAVTGALDAAAAGLQQCADDGTWAEWVDARGRRIQELDDDDPLFMAPSQERRHLH